MTLGVDQAAHAGDLRQRAVGMLTDAGERMLRVWRRVVGAWQRSIQLRVVTATLALSAVVVLLLGMTLLRQVTDGLLSQQRDTALAETTAGIRIAQNLLDAADEGGATASNLLIRQIVRDLTFRGGPEGDANRPAVVLFRDDTPTFSRDVEPSSVPQALRDETESKNSVFWTYTLITYGSEQGPDRAAEPGLAAGGQVLTPTGERYGLYYLFPLTEQEQTLDLVRTALATAGLVLVLLLGAIAGLVTRQVVTPVRMAAQIAERFSAGRLAERMVVKNRDDIGRLAISFNQMAGSLQRQIGQLEELSRVQQQFVSDVSHELRTPLTTVRMAADVLHESREEFDDPVVRRSAELLQAQLDRFESLLADLLEISRFDAGAAVLNAEAVDVRDIVHAVMDAAAPLAARRGSEVSLDVPSTPCVAEVDARRIERVMRNLVVNAIEHGEGRGVEVRVAADENAVAIAVRDHGVGLKPGESSLVFHRFWRADPARARSTGGTGLGLAIALEDARLHGGWLQAWGEPGAGSQFRLTLPCRNSDDLTASPIPLVPGDAAHDGGLDGVGGPYRQTGPVPAEPTEAGRHA
ncbi:MAG TPA: MtrAB system histidine kinase MtrB [Jiangellaceae bacterium]|nr:MtrAB system histidine kinase MtrB [Jiangellaceae bacterium]